MDELFKQFVERYMKMGGGEDKAIEMRMNVHLKEIEQDRNPGKRISHARLLSLINELTLIGLIRLYTKCNLQ